MQLEFKRANEILVGEVLCLLIIIRVIHLHLELFRLLEVEVYQDLLDELGVQVVVDDFSLSDPLPHPTLLFVHDAERVRVGHGIHIGKILALKANRELVRETTTAEIGCCKDSRVNITSLSHFAARCHSVAVQVLCVHTVCVTHLS